jgi:hypothetical protein
MNKTIAELVAESFDFGLEAYPIYDETYRDGLNAKILNHYNRYEIGEENPAIFKEFLNLTMVEIMPYYNQLYTSAALTIDPLISFSRTETTEAAKTENRIATNSGAVVVDTDTGSTESEIVDGTDTTTATNSSTATDTVSSTANRTSGVEQTSTNERAENQSERNFDKNVESDTPAGLLAMDDIESHVYASRAVIGDKNRTATIGADVQENLDRAETEANTASGTNTNETEATASGTTNTDRTTTRTNAGTIDGTTTTTGEMEQNVLANETGTRTESGHDRPLAELVEAHRKTFLNIDMMVIRALADCFMLAYEWDV